MSDPFHDIWATSVMHGQACWSCGAKAPLLGAQLVPILAEGTSALALSRHGLEPTFDLASPRNQALVCAACAGAPPADIRVWLDKAGRLAAEVRRAALDAEFGAGMGLALAAVRRRPPGELSRDDIAPLAVAWAAHQAKKTAHARAGVAVRDRLAEAEVRYKPPPPLQLDVKVSVAFGLGLVSQLSDFSWALARAA